MAFKDKNLNCWAGQVKKVMNGEYARLLESPKWKQIGEASYQYRKVKRGFKTKTEAAAWETDHWKKIFETQVDPTATIRITFSSISSQYLSQVETRSTGKNTRQYKTKLIQDLIGFWGQDLPLPIQTIEIENFLNYIFKEQGGKKANRSLRELSTLFTWMLNRQFIAVDPTTPIEKYPESEFKKYVPPAEDLKKIIQIANAFEKDVIRTAYHTLARSSELRRLKKSDCDFLYNKVTLYTRKRQGGSLEGDKIDMDNTLREILFRRCALSESDYVFPCPDGKKISKNTFDKIMPRVCRKVNESIEDTAKKMKPFGLHSIRHHVAAHLFLNCNYSVAELQKILRHKRASTTDNYLKSIIDMDTTRGLSALDENNFESRPDKKEESGKLLSYPGSI